MAAHGEVDVQQVKSCCCETAGHKNHRIRAVKPGRQHEDHVDQCQRAGHIAGPGDLPVQLQVTQQGDEDRQQEHGQHHTVDGLGADAQVRVPMVMLKADC